MKLVYWMYAGPAHIGTLRVASSFKNVHAIMHAPLGDDYFNVMRSMLERERDFTPVTASIVDRHVLTRGSQDKVVDNITRKDKEERPNLIILTPTCTSSILQEDLQNFVDRASIISDSDVILADVNHYRVNELQAADKTLEQVVRYYLGKARRRRTLDQSITDVPSANIIGISTLGFHNQHDFRELKRLLQDLGIKINQVIPEGSFVEDLENLPKAWFNFVPYREIGLMTAVYLEKEFGIPYVSVTPMGVVDTAKCIRQIQKHINNLAVVALEETVDYEPYVYQQTQFVSQAIWFSKSIDCQNLKKKKAVIFGDATHAASMTKILNREMGIRVSCAGTYCKHDKEWFNEQVHNFCDEVLITDDHAEVANKVARIEPSAIFGTQMERHIGKRLNIPCGVVSAPVHIQNFPLGYRPFSGYEGTNQIADSVYNSFIPGMEDHFIDLFGGHDTKEVIMKSLCTEKGVIWDPESQLELSKIPSFMRSKIKRKIDKFAVHNGFTKINIKIMYAALICL
uniref:Light-independent protochlorophyllide reductase subunit B n=3 Tax=Huperzia TaxID=37428 RepID=CHLB_HUPLU|nr:protochlorophyllide reductase ChlB subunit [Huperzia serrata]YP_209539.1 photochlorophyllide reductase subunit B [Huperzia lucidula]Q5SCX2.1 RecName: Full=Light-independent protochlorophyllide reductase subunit B; Short=DPOR subunit B; Short=LI-POR subunit B [Huperzia lucidula]AAT80735.1 protochlorophyllide reductase ChlB subunit [Huperzia lucidula]APF31887.1 protochlorophyllide reductase ChlB subunit [Huperzia serrata]AZU95481.1 protochlorophyllide reductase ChlB subunit [Huperzia lucidula